VRPLNAHPLRFYISADFSFLAKLAYREVNITQDELDGWFGEGVAVDRNDYVEQFRNRTSSQVSFKMITFPQKGNFSIVSSKCCCDDIIERCSCC